MSCTNITWPSTSLRRLQYRHYFYWFALLQGSVQVITTYNATEPLFYGVAFSASTASVMTALSLQVLQNYYWSKRNYTAVTLGKANSMTVVPNSYTRLVAARVHLQPSSLTRFAAKHCCFDRLFSCFCVCSYFKSTSVTYLLVAHLACQPSRR